MLSRTLSLSCLRFFFAAIRFWPLLLLLLCFFLLIHFIHYVFFASRTFFSSFISNETKIGSFCIGCSSLNWLFYLCAQKLLSILFWLIAIFLVLPLLPLLLPLPALFNSDWWSWPACSNIWFIKRERQATEIKRFKSTSFRLNWVEWLRSNPVSGSSLKMKQKFNFMWHFE